MLLDTWEVLSPSVMMLVKEVLCSPGAKSIEQTAESNGVKWLLRTSWTQSEERGSTLAMLCVDAWSQHHITDSNRSRERGGTRRTEDMVASESCRKKRRGNERITKSFFCQFVSMQTKLTALDCRTWIEKHSFDFWEKFEIQSWSRCHLSHHWYSYSLFPTSNAGLPPENT
jgi:hypothetical protein